MILGAGVLPAAISSAFLLVLGVSCGGRRWGNHWGQEREAAVVPRYSAVTVAVSSCHGPGPRTAYGG
jgi:hypothetical protein